MPSNHRKYQATAHKSQPQNQHLSQATAQKDCLDEMIDPADNASPSLSSSHALRKLFNTSWEEWGPEVAELELWEQPTWRFAPITVHQESEVSKSSRVAWYRPWLYRGWLLVATMGLALMLLRLQAVLDTVSSRLSIWQLGVQWAELSWLVPVPLAAILWLGWFIFAEAVQADPAPIEVPFVNVDRGLLAYSLAEPVSLVFRFVTRGDNLDVLRNSVMAVHRAFTRYPLKTGPYRIEIISECPLSLGAVAEDKTCVYVVPADYVTRNQSRFKARALTYLQEQVCPGETDWYIYLDEESLIDEVLLAGIYRFISRSLQPESSVLRTARKQLPAGLIGQGAILYHGGDRFFRGADALRTADDLGRFRLQYALGAPIFGAHGSYIVIRGVDDTRLSFDVGSANSIAEDTAWALYAWSKGFRFEWVEGYLQEQPPQSVTDFVKQRSRWLSGIRFVLRDTGIPLRYRLCLGIFASSWQLAFLPFMVAVAALFVHVSPFVWMRLPADFAWATFVLAYFQGIDVQITHARRTLQTRIFSWVFVLCCVWYSLLEAGGVLYSLLPKQEFFVIRKPSLTSPLIYKEPIETHREIRATIANRAKAHEKI